MDYADWSTQDRSCPHLELGKGVQKAQVEPLVNSNTAGGERVNINKGHCLGWQEEASSQTAAAGPASSSSRDSPQIWGLSLCTR